VTCETPLFQQTLSDSDPGNNFYNARKKSFWKHNSTLPPFLCFFSPSDDGYGFVEQWLGLWISFRLPILCIFCGFSACLFLCAGTPFIVKDLG